MLTTIYTGSDFLKEQQKYPRVREAIREKSVLIDRKLSGQSLKKENVFIIIQILKEEKLLNIYGKTPGNSTYKPVASYDICASSGKAGPKRSQGDYQVPEGFYHIDRFNPVSNYYLSLGINYPNASDKIKTIGKDPGGDIFIHGSCVTIGCLPMTDEFVKEIYLLAVYARSSGQLKIPVYIFPFKMTAEKMQTIEKSTDIKPEVIEFWKQLKPGYDAFESLKSEISFTISNDGSYLY
jgi:murein L,D-transpeptidase YafK